MEPKGGEPAGLPSFERAQLDQALEILAREERHGPLSSGRRRWLRPLIWYGYSVAVIASLIGLALGAYEIRDHWDNPDGCAREVIHAVLAVFVHMTLVLGPINIVAAALLHSSAFPLLVGAWRWRRGLRAAGLEESLRAPWREERARHRLRNTITLLMGPWILAWGLMFALVRLAGGGDLPSYGHGPLLHLVRVSDTTVFACTLLTVPLGFHYLLLHYLIREMERVRVVRELMAALRGAAERGAGEVLLTPAFRQAASIERAQIARERLRSIERFEQRGVAAYLVRKSQAFRRALAELPDPVQVRVQDRILALSGAPHVGGVRRAAGGETRWIDVPGTELELGFTVDDVQHALVVLALRPATRSPAGAEPGEAR